MKNQFLESIGGGHAPPGPPSGYAHVYLIHQIDDKIYISKIYYQIAKMKYERFNYKLPWK